MIVAHNHPSGTTIPSADDTILTRRLAASAHMMGIEIIDHVIIGKGYYSYAMHQSQDLTAKAKFEAA